jgi:hypothetical protein
MNVAKVFLGILILSYVSVAILVIFISVVKNSPLWSLLS